MTSRGMKIKTSTFQRFMLEPGAVLPPQIRVLDVSFIIGGGIIIAVGLILILAAWNETTRLKSEVNELKKNITELMEPMKRAVDNSIGVFELREAKGIARGYASLDSNGKIPLNQMPKLSISNSNTPRTVDASLISATTFPNAKMKILKPGRCIQLKETNSYVEIDFTC